jgi:hypothetical protein
MLSAAEARFLETRTRILSRPNPALLERQSAEFEAMTDAEIAAVAGLPAPQPQIGEGRAMGADGFGEISFVDRYGAEDRKAKYQAACEAADEAAKKATNETDKLWLSWYELDRFIEAGCEDDLFNERERELWQPIFDRFNEIEEQIADMIPASLGDCLIQLRVLKSHWPTEPGEVDDQLVDNLLAGVEIMVATGEPSAGIRRRVAGQPRESPAENAGLSRWIDSCREKRNGRADMRPASVIGARRSPPWRGIYLSVCGAARARGFFGPNWR